MPIPEKFLIQGLGGKKTLKGTVTINGAKNAALKAMAAAVLFDGPVTLENVPDTADVETMIRILRKLGAKAEWKGADDSRFQIADSRTEQGKKILEIDPTSIHSTDIDVALATSMRSSVVLTGPMLARYGKVSLPAPGGCVIGARPIDLFIEGYKEMGAPTVLRDDIYKIEAPRILNGADIHFKKVISVTATETLMMAAVLANGKTILKNCACEPEIVNVAEWLNACGAKIIGAGTSIIEVEGRNGELLSSKKASYVAIPDRIEAGSFLILGALCAEDLLIKDCRPDHLTLLIDMLTKSGVQIEVGADFVRVTNPISSGKASASFKSFDVRTSEYPGFATDLQSPIVTFLTQATGESKVTETIFEGRFKYTEDLKKMGADISVLSPQEILIKGPSVLNELPAGEELRAHDIRAGFAIVLAALCGTGKFTVNNIHLIDRGYEKLEERLRALGADMERVQVAAQLSVSDKDMLLAKKA